MRRFLFSLLALIAAVSCTRSVDVLVVGGGASGTAAGVQAARMQGIININNLHQCIVMISDNDTIPLLYEEHVVKVNTGKNMFLKIKGVYYRVIEYNETVLAQSEILQGIDMGKKDIYGTNSQLSATTNITSLSGDGGTMTQLTPNTDMRYTYEQRPVFISGHKVAFLNEKMLCKMYKKKSAIVKEYFATHDVDTYSMDQARELYEMLIK